MGLISITKKGVRRVAKSTPWRDVLDCVASNPRHDGEVSSPQWRGIKNKEKNNKEHNENTLVYAVEGDEMIELWNVWVRERKAYVKGTYTPYAQQRAMNKLQRLCNEDIEQARKIIDQSITNAWKTFTPSVKKEENNGLTSTQDKHLTGLLEDPRNSMRAMTPEVAYKQGLSMSLAQKTKPVELRVMLLTELERLTRHVNATRTFQTQTDLQDAVDDICELFPSLKSGRSAYCIQAYPSRAFPALWQLHYKHHAGLYPPIRDAKHCWHA